MWKEALLSKGRCDYTTTLGSPAGAFPAYATDPISLPKFLII